MESPRSRSTGRIEVICGGMYSGKTEELLRRVRRAQYAKVPFQLFKPGLDQRYSADHVQSHDANKLPSINVGSALEILDHYAAKTQIVAIDEVQFFNEQIVTVAQKLADYGVTVICAGLDLDFLGKPFGPMPDLLCVAESVTKLSAVCMVCGAAASRSQRLVYAETQVWVGAKGAYEARCRACHEPRAIEQTQDLFLGNP